MDRFQWEKFSIHLFGNENDRDGHSLNYGSLELILSPGPELWHIWARSTPQLLSCFWWGLIYLNPYHVGTSSQEPDFWFSKRGPQGPRLELLRDSHKKITKMSFLPRWAKMTNFNELFTTDSYLEIKMIWAVNVWIWGHVGPFSPPPPPGLNLNIFALVQFCNHLAVFAGINFIES